MTLLAAEALRARAVACTLLGGPESEARSAWQAMESCPAEALELFLRIERCALPLRARLAEYQLSQETPEALMTVITARSTRELQRALSARAQLSKIARLAQEHGWTAIVLKGGVTIANGGQVDVHDVDILMRAEEGGHFATLLDSSGYATDPELRPLHHLSARHTRNDVAIEIHHEIPALPALPELLDRAVRLDAIPGLWRLGHVDHLWHLLVHSTLQHPERRGNLRDATILAQVVDACSPADLATLLTHIETHTEAPTLRATLLLAQDFAARRLTVDPFAECALRKYPFCSRYDGRSNVVRERTVRFLCGDRSFVHALQEDFALPNELHSMFAPINWLNRRMSWLAVPLRQCLRVGRLGLVAGLAAQNAWDVRRVTRRWREA